MALRFLGTRAKQDFVGLWACVRPLCFSSPLPSVPSCLSGRKPPRGRRADKREERFRFKLLKDFLQQTRGFVGQSSGSTFVRGKQAQGADRVGRLVCLGVFRCLCFGPRSIGLGSGKLVAVG